MKKGLFSVSQWKEGKTNEVEREHRDFQKEVEKRGLSRENRKSFKFKKHQSW